MGQLKLTDTHAHLDFENFSDNLDEVIEKSFNAGVQKIIIPGVTIDKIPQILAIIDKYDNVYGAVAQHPSEMSEWREEYSAEIEKYASYSKIIAIGETGLDYYWDKTFVEKQKQIFRLHLKIAEKFKLPVIVHNREAHYDTLEILKEFPAVKGVMHCFSGSAEFALECINIGYYIALGGPVTFKNAKKPLEVAKNVPIDRLLLETDSPFLAPHPYRGKQNSPDKLLLIAEEIAKIKGITFEELAKRTTGNAETLFNI